MDLYGITEPNQESLQEIQETVKYVWLKEFLPESVSLKGYDKGVSMDSLEVLLMMEMAARTMDDKEAVMKKVVKAAGNMFKETSAISGTPGS